MSALGRWLAPACALTVTAALAACGASPTKARKPTPSQTKVPEALSVSDPAYAVRTGSTLTMSESFACATTAAAGVRCWGLLGLGQREVVSSEGPFTVPNLDEVVEVAAGTHHMCARKRDGTVWCWGEGDAFRLGRKLKKGMHGPTQVPKVQHAVALAVGSVHSCAVLRDGSARCWGSYENGKLGLDHLDHVTEPGNVAMDIPNATGVALTSETTCMRTAEGKVFCWGVEEELNANQKSLMVGVAEATRLVIDGISTCALRKNDVPKCWTNLTEIVSLSEVSKLATAVGRGGDCAIVNATLTCPLVEDPELDLNRMDYSEEDGGETDDAAVPTVSVSDATELVIVGDTACARVQNGDVLCWGSNHGWLLGRGQGGAYPTAVTVALPTPITALSYRDGKTCALGQDSKEHCWGEHNGSEADWDGWRRPSAHTCSKQSSGFVTCSGSASYGQLGAEKKMPPPTPTRQKLGKNAGILGLLSQPPPAFRSFHFQDDVKRVAGVKQATLLATSAAATCALTASGILCWGNTGVRTQTYVPRMETNAFSGKDVVVGPCTPSRSPSAFNDDDDDDDDDDVSPGEKKQRAAACAELRRPRPIAGSANARSLIGYDETFCMVRANYTVACWGGDTWGDTPVDVTDLAETESLHVGAMQVCALDRKGRLSCGEDIGNTKRVDTFAAPIRQWFENPAFQCAIATSGAVLCTKDDGLGSKHYNPESYGQAKPVAGVSSAKSLLLGPHHACALTSDGTVKCWGFGDANMNRKLDVLKFASQPTRIAIGDRPPAAKK